VRELALIVSVLVFASIAHAHGRPPNVGQIAIDPMDPDRIVVQMSFGLLVSDDGGTSFRFVCSAAFGADPNIEDPSFAFVRDRGIVLGTFDGIQRAEPDLCSFAAAPGTATNTFVIHVAADPHGENGVWAATAAVPDPDAIQHSDDGGRTWEIVSRADRDLLVERITPAPSDPMRLYLGAFSRQTAELPRRGFVMRSTDGGVSFERIEVPLVPDEQTPLVVAVDPTDADRIFVRVRKPDSEITGERLLYSEDGGDSFDVVLTLPAIDGFAISADGQTVYAASSDGGVYRATGGTTTFQMVSDVSVRALALAPDGVLWMTVEPYRHRFALAVYDGTTVEPIMWLEDVTQLFPCEICSEMFLLCNEYLPDLIYDVDRFLGPMEMELPPRFDGGLIEACMAEGGVLPFDAGRAIDAGRSVDAGMNDAGMTETPPGCGCRSARGSSIPIALVMLLFFWRRR
jgi:hypothetical protein